MEIHLNFDSQSNSRFQEKNLIDALFPVILMEMWFDEDESLETTRHWEDFVISTRMI